MRVPQLAMSRTPDGPRIGPIILRVPALRRACCNYFGSLVRSAYMRLAILTLNTSWLAAFIDLQPLKRCMIC